MKEKIKVAILGCSGVVGQVFMWLLADHDWFEVCFISASTTRSNKKYGDDVRWMLPMEIPQKTKKMQIERFEHSALKERGIKIIFSALPADVAKTIEGNLRDDNFYVFSNASAFRYEDNIPILIPEANRESLVLIEKQGYPERGFIVTNANCSTTGLAVALAPLKKFGIKEVFVSTYQSISGAGYPGLSAMDIGSNVIPFIQSEEGKMITEIKKILSLSSEIYPFCVRVPTLFGHLETVWLEFEEQIEEKDLVHVWNKPIHWGDHLPGFPLHSTVYSQEKDFPQTKITFWGDPAGMPVYIGGLRKKNNRFGFRLLVNNIVKGAAGGSIQNAALFAHTYGEIE